MPTKRSSFGTASNARGEKGEILERFLVDAYRASVFKTVQHQALPTMHGPPLEFHLKEEVCPTAVYTPATVSIHWTENVKADLDRDVALRVLKKVWPNEPITGVTGRWYVGSITVTHVGLWTCRP